MFPAVAVVISSFVEGFIWDSYTFIGLSLMLAGNLVVLAKPGLLKRLSSTRSKLASCSPSK